MAEWETVGKSNDGWEDVDGWETVSPEKRKTTLLENVGISLNTAAQPFVKGAGLLAGGAATLLGSTDTADSIYKTMEDTTKSMDEYWTPKDAEQSFGGKLQGIGMTLPSQMLSMFASPFDTGQTAIKAGEDLSTAQKAVGIDTVGNALGVALPAAVGKTMLTKAITGGVGNAAQDLATRAAISGISDTKEMKEKFEPTAESAAIAGIIGTGFGVKEHLDSAGTAPQIKTGSPYKSKDTKVPEVFDAKVDADVTNAITVREASIKAIEQQLALQRDPTSEYSQRLLADIKQKTDELVKLYAYKGEVPPNPDVRNTPETAVEAPRIDDQLQTEYNTRLAELNALESEYKYISKSGAALTTEQKTRLQEIEQRHAEVSDFLEQNASKVIGEQTPTEVKTTQEPITTEDTDTFVPAVDRYQVNDQVESRDYAKFSLPVLEKMLQNKQDKINSVHESILRNGLGSPAGQSALGFKRLLEREYAHIEAEYNKKFDQQKKSDFDFNSAAEQKISWILREPLVEALNRGGIREGLGLLADPKNRDALSPYGKYLSDLAKTLLDNPLVGHGRYVEDPNFEHAGGYNNISGYVHMKGDATSSPVVFLHEVVHSAVNRALALFDRGQLKDPKQAYAAKNINDLYNKIKLTPTLLAKIEKAMKGDAPIVLENTREFVAYGLSDQRFQLALNTIKLGDQTVFSRLTNSIKNMLNLNKNERTALDDVIRYGETLINVSEGLPPGFDPNGTFSYSRLTTPQDYVAAIKSGSLKIFSHLFTQNMRQMMRDNPYFSAMEKKIAQAEKAKEFLVRTISYGIDAIPDWRKKGSYQYKVSGTESEKALVPSMYHLKDEQLYSVYNVLMDGYRKGIDAAETIKSNLSKWSPEEARFAEAINHGVTKLWETSVKMLANKNLDYTKLKQRIGYMLTSRIGDHAAQVYINNVLVRQQHFLTKAEADHFVSEIKKQNPSTKIEAKYEHVDSLKQGNDTNTLRDFLNTVGKLHGDELEKVIQNTQARMTTENASIGSHTMQSNIVSGFIGNQLGMTPKQMGAQLRTALPRMVENYAQNIMSRSLQKDYIDFLIDNEHKMDPTTQELLSFYLQTQIGQPFKEGSVPDLARKLSNGIRESIDTVIDKTFGYKNRDKHAVDRFMGLFGNAFYIANILMKPAIWVAQPLQALNSGRSAFKEGETPRQVLTALGQTMLQASLGKKYIQSNPELEKALHDVSQHFNTLHPQMTNDYNDMKIGTNPNSAINKTVDIISGKKISAWGDMKSRYLSFLFFYNLHKQSGLKGKELIDTAARDTTENMVAYGSKKLPAIYRETGMLGEQGSTLATFAHTQMGNLIVDLKEFTQKPGARTAAPLIMTAAITTILGGAIALPIVAEYEILRQFGIKFGWWGPDSWPNVSEMILDNAPRWTSMGLLSDATGIDMDASMRYTSLFNKIVDIEKQGMIAFSPHLAWGKEMVANIPTAISPWSTVPARDQALKKVLPKGWVSGVVDQTRNDFDLVGDQKNLFTRMGKKGQGGVQRDTAAKIAPFFGSQSTKQSMDTRKQLASKEREDAKVALLEKSIQYLVHGDKELGKKAFDKLLTKYYMGDSQALENGIQSQIAKMNTEGLYNNYWDAKTGNVSPEQQSRILRDNLGEYLKRRKGQ